MWNNRFLDWMFDHFLLVMAVFFIVGVIATLWAYDGDPKCLVAECRRVHVDH